MIQNTSKTVQNENQIRHPFPVVTSSLITPIQIEHEII
jgi:hypothetical protein